MTQRERPLSPHLQVYRWQITMTMSILHRATGCALAAGAFLFAWWLVAVAMGPDAYATFTECLRSPLGLVALFGFSLALVYHTYNGIRHLLWDIGYGYEIPKFYATGWAVTALTLVTTLAVWFVGWTGGTA